MKVHINDLPDIAIKWIDNCILSKTTDKFVKVATTFAIINFKSTLDNTIIESFKLMADDNGYIDIDTFCDNLITAIDSVGDSVNIPLGMFIKKPFISSLSIDVTKQDISTMKTLMREKGVN